ncbi:hypothetical protein ACWCWD_29480 [Streptomyces sp. NPDC001493]
MSGNEPKRQRVARVYTAARRHPWVLGKLGDWVIWFGPYTPAQLLVLGGGALLLVKTFAWWSWLGPVPVVVWLVAVWAVRGAKIGGRSPLVAAAGWVALLARHPAGRIGGRVARDRRPSTLSGTFVVGPLAPPAIGVVDRREAVVSRRRPGRGRRGAERPGVAPLPVPVSGLTGLLARIPVSAGVR